MFKRTSNSGFTIVELLIVIVVIGILAAITIVAFNGIQQRGRDTQRVHNITTIKKSLELFHAENSFYPTSNQIQDATFRRDTLKLPDDVARATNSSSTIGYCWSTNPSQFCYVSYPPASSTNTNCTGSAPNPDTECIRYTLSYRLEKDPAVRIDIQSAVRP